MISTVKTNEGHSQRSNCRKHHNHVLSSYRYWRCMWLRLSVWVSVCAHTLRCNMELLMATKGAFDCHFFWYWRKKKDHPAPLRLICSSLPTLSHFILRFVKFVLLWKRHIVVYIQLLLCSGEQRGFGQGTRNGTGSRSQSALTSEQTTLAGRKIQKAGTNSTFAKTSGLFVQPSCCSLFDVQHSRKRPDPARSSSVRPPWTRHKTTAGHQHCNFLTYNKAISYFLPYKWK